MTSPTTSPVILLDNSAAQRTRHTAVWNALADLRGSSEFATCLPLLLEQGYSARNADEHEVLIRTALNATLLLSTGQEIVSLALSIQAALFRAGKGRAVGVSDLQIAATAIHYSTEARPVVLVHYDRDFDHIASVEPRLHSRWIVPPGSAG
jgi:hypothetical protein